MKLPCGCEARWLTQLSEPTGLYEALAEPCACCGTPAGEACGNSGVIRATEPTAVPWGDVCPGRHRAALDRTGQLALQ